MTVSRWVRGNSRPTAGTFIKLADLSDSGRRRSFLELAGLEGPTLAAHSASSQPRNISVVTRVNQYLHDVEARESGESAGPQPDAVMIPVMESENSQSPDLPQCTRLSSNIVKHVITAPSSWCQNPESLMGFALYGDPMSRLISPGSVLIVDVSRNDVGTLEGKIVLASHRERGVTVGWLRRFSSIDLLMPENPARTAVLLSGPSGWRISGEVVWWITMPPTR